MASSTPTYLAYTPTNDTWVTTNESGDQTGYWGYDAYGTLAFGTPTSPFGYSGQYQDATTGLVNDRARWYEPQTGGFTTVDPDLAETDTAYTYADGDPVNNSDPLGLCSGLGWFDGDCETRAAASAVSSAATSAYNAASGYLFGVSQCFGPNGACTSPQGYADIGAGIANTAINALNGLMCINSDDPNCAQEGIPSIGIPYPCEAAGSQQVGEGLFYAGGLLVPGGDEADLGSAGAGAGGAEAEGLSGALEPIGAPSEFDPQSLAGETPAQIEARIPSDWVESPSKSGGGTVFSDPANPGRQIRIMPGYGEGVRPDPLTAGPYAVVSQNGVVTKVPLAGNPTLP